MSRTVDLIRRLDHRAHAVLGGRTEDIGPFPPFPAVGVRHRDIWVRPYPADDPIVVAARLALENCAGIEFWRPAHFTPMRTIEQAHQWCASQRDGVLAGRPASLAIIEEKSGAYAGDINFKIVHPDALPVVELGAALLPDFRGGRIAQTAGALLSTWLLDIAAVPRLELRHSVHNRGACFVSLRLGYRREGILRAAMPLADEGGQARLHDVCLHAFVGSDTRPENWPTTMNSSPSMRVSVGRAAAGETVTAQ